MCKISMPLTWHPPFALPGPTAAGPLEDIVVTTVDPTTGQPHDTGFLAETTEEYADAITQVRGRKGGAKRAPWGAAAWT
jgi:hypothetical protein